MPTMRKEEEDEEEEEEEDGHGHEVRKQKPYRPPNLSRSMPLDADDEEEMVNHGFRFYENTRPTRDERDLLSWGDARAGS
jgi:hypothetical protein